MDRNQKFWTVTGLSLHCFSFVELMNMLIQLWVQTSTSAQKFIRGNIIPRGMFLDMFSIKISLMNDP